MSRLYRLAPPGEAVAGNPSVEPCAIVDGQDHSKALEQASESAPSLLDIVKAKTTSKTTSTTATSRAVSQDSQLAPIHREKWSGPKWIDFDSDDNARLDAKIAEWSRPHPAEPKQRGRPSKKKTTRSSGKTACTTVGCNCE